MIRHPIQPEPKQVDDIEYLKGLIQALRPDWLGRADSKTQTFRTDGDYNESSPIWSEIKDVFLDLQSGKCAYCERKLGGKSYNRKEYDVEHYRPKNKVGSWPSKKALEKMIERGQRPYKFPMGEETTKGYYLLPYNISNYAAACTGCNSTLKSNYFPIANKRVLDSDDYDLLKTEEPYLLFPIGETDDDPEDMITFRGVLPVPTKKSGPKYRRARVTIDFFDLDIRPELIEERARIIQNIWLAFMTISNRNSDEDLNAHARKIIELALSPSSPHANCARSFHKLCQKNRHEARQLKAHAQRILEEIG
jgi:hypothetical protein